jgi:chromosome segregation ATPase
VVQKRLSNLESEVTIATKVLKGTKMEGDRAVKEREYYEGLVAELETKKQSLTKDVESLSATKAELEKACADFRAEMATAKSEHEIRTAEHSKREDAVSTREADVMNVSNELTSKTNKLEEEKAVFNAKVAKVREVVSNI